MRSITDRLARLLLEDTPFEDAELDETPKCTINWLAELEGYVEPEKHVEVEENDGLEEKQPIQAWQADAAAVAEDLAELARILESGEIPG